MCFASLFNNSGTWLTKETDLFLIHYKSENFHLVDKINNYATTIHNELSQFFKFDPVKELGQKTHLVLVTTTDEINSLATPIPQNTIYLYPNLPLEDSILHNYDSFLNSLILHEYTHIINLSSKRGVVKLFYKIFGNIISPNILQPLWLTEGFAVWAESTFSKNENYGRLKSPLSDMIFRMSFCKNTIPPLDTIGYETPNWPLGNITYLYGGKIIDEISKNFGKIKVGELSYSNSGTLPYFINCSANNIFSHNYHYIYEKFISTNITFHKELCLNLEEKKSSKSKLTQNGFSKTALTVNEDILMFNSYNPDTGSKIEGINIDKGSFNTNTIFKTSIFGRNLSAFRSLAVFSKFNVDKFKNNFSQLYFLNLETREIRPFRIKNSLGAIWRIRDPYISKDGKLITAIRLEPYKHSLILLKSKKDTFTYDTPQNNFDPVVLIEFPDGWNVGTPRFSPDNKKIIFTIKQEKGRNIYLYELDSKKLHQLTFSENSHLLPNWMSEDKIIYSHDEDGIFNIYKLNLKTNIQYKLTHLTGGAFNPVFYKNEIYFIGYNQTGYDIYKMISKEVKSEKKLPESINITVQNNETLSESPIEDNKYNSIYYMFPKSWFPYFLMDNENNKQAGLITFGSDPLFKNIYSLFSFYDSKKETILYDLYFQNSSFFTPLGISTSKGYYNYSLGRISKNYSVSLWIPIHGNIVDYTNIIDHSSNNGAYIRYSYIDDPRNFKSSHLTLGFKNDARGRYLKSINYAKGSWLNINYKIYNQFIESKFNAHSFEGVYEKYFSLYKHLIYKPSLHGAVFSSSKNFFFLGGINQPFNLSSSVPMKPSLKGFKKDSIEAKHFGSLNHEIYFPITYIYRGFRTYPYFINNFSGSVGHDCSFIKQTSGTNKFYNSLSFSLNKSFIVGYYLNLNLKFEYSYGFGKEGDNFFYVFLGSSNFR